jgi:predicted Zn finger-like uncharacterized protein
MDIRCPNCGRGYRIADEHTGKRIRCKNCGAPFTVEAAQDLPQAEAPETPGSGSSATGAGRRPAGTEVRSVPVSVVAIAATALAGLALALPVFRKTFGGVLLLAADGAVFGTLVGVAGGFTRRGWKWGAVGLAGGLGLGFLEIVGKGVPLDLEGFCVRSRTEGPGFLGFLGALIFSVAGPAILAAWFSGRALPRRQKRLWSSLVPAFLLAAICGPVFVRSASKEFYARQGTPDPADVADDLRRALAIEGITQGWTTIEEKQREIEALKRIFSSQRQGKELRFLAMSRAEKAVLLLSEMSQKEGKGFDRRRVEGLIRAYFDVLRDPANSEEIREQAGRWPIELFGDDYIFSIPDEEKKRIMYDLEDVLRVLVTDRSQDALSFRSACDFLEHLKRFGIDAPRSILDEVDVSNP